MARRMFCQFYIEINRYIVNLAAHTGALLYACLDLASLSMLCLLEA